MRKEFFLKKKQKLAQRHNASKWQNQDLHPERSASIARWPTTQHWSYKSPNFIPGTLSSKEEQVCHDLVLFHKTDHYDDELS